MLSESQVSQSSPVSYDQSDIALKSPFEDEDERDSIWFVWTMDNIKKEVHANQEAGEFTPFEKIFSKIKKYWHWWILCIERRFSY